MARLIRQNGTSEEIDMRLQVKPKEQEAAIQAALISKHVADKDATPDFHVWKCPEDSLAFKEGYVYVAALVGRGMQLKANFRAQNYSGNCKVKADADKKLIGPLLFLKIDEVHSKVLEGRRRWV